MPYHSHKIDNLAQRSYVKFRSCSFEVPAIHLPHHPTPECTPGHMTVDNPTKLLSCPHLPPREHPVEHPGVDNELQELMLLPTITLDEQIFSSEDDAVSSASSFLRFTAK